MATKSIRLTDGTDTLLPESATSASGYQKNADGTLICWGVVSIATSTDRAKFEFPVSFTAIPSITLQVSENGNAAMTVFSWQESTSSAYALLKSPPSRSYAQPIKWIAIGRWK